AGGGRGGEATWSHERLPGRCFPQSSTPTAVTGKIREDPPHRTDVSVCSRSLFLSPAAGESRPVRVAPHVLVHWGCRGGHGRRTPPRTSGFASITASRARFCARARAGFPGRVFHADHPITGVPGTGCGGGGRFRPRVGASPTPLSDLTCATGGGVVALIGRLLPRWQRKRGKNDQVHHRARLRSWRSWTAPLRVVGLAGRGRGGRHGRPGPGTGQR